MNDIVKMTAADAGCLVDGHRGIYAAQEVIDLAIDCGWEPDEEGGIGPFLAVRWMNDWEVDTATREQCGEAVLNQGGWLDDAEAWLNEHAAPEGYLFGWHDGEFFLSPYCGRGEEDRCGDDSCWCQT